MTTFDKAWEVVKMPILEPQPGIKFGYDSLEPVKLPQQAIDDMIVNDRFLDVGLYPSIGNIPYAWNNRDAIKYMTPDDYFDLIASAHPSEPHPRFLGPRGRKFRWTHSDDETSPFVMMHKKRLNQIIEGIKEGKIIGMPELQVSGDNDEYEGMQEGGHRMDALRQMGFADTPVPVFLHRRR